MQIQINQNFISTKRRKKILNVKEFLAGYKISKGEKLKLKLNYQIIIEYLGANFVGWQFQKNGSSIQSNLEKALSKTLRSKIKIIGSGRTDAGVNAWGQSANFYVENQLKIILNFYRQ